MMIRAEFVALLLVAAPHPAGCGLSETTASGGTEPATGTTVSSSTSDTSSCADTSSGPPPQTSSTESDPGTTTSTSGPDIPAGFLNPLEIPDYSECTTWAENCPAGEKCMPIADDGGNWWSTSACRPVVPNPDAVGESCTLTQGTDVDGYDTCEVHAMCWGVDDDAQGSCVGFCSGDESSSVCLEADAACSISGDGFLALCLPTCNPLVQPCPAGEGCYPIDVGFICAADSSGDMGLEGDPCELINACDAGLYRGAGDCGASGRCCLPFCDISQPDCPAGTECVSAFPEGVPAPAGLGSVGLCATVDD